MLHGIRLASALVALASPLCALDTVGAGFGADSAQALPSYTAFASYDTLANGNRLVFDGALVYFEAADGTFLQTIAGTPMVGFPSFLQVDPTETFAILGESTNGALYRVSLTGTLTLLGTLDFNYAFTFEPGAATGIVSAAVCSATCTNILHRLDVTTGATTPIATIDGPSGPVAFSPAGDLYYATQSNSYPTPPGFVDILRWSAAQVARGPFPLTAARATVFVNGLDGGESLAFDPLFGNLFVSGSPGGMDGRILEIDRYGQTVGTVASSLDYVSDVEVIDVAGDGALAAFQPAGKRLQYRATDFNTGTARVVRVSPRRPELTAVQHMDGTMTISLTGATPNTSCFVISSQTSLNNPVESAHDLGSHLFWTGMPYPNNIRRLGNQIMADAIGNGSFTFANPTAIQGTRVVQVLVRDSSGVLRGASATVTN